MILSYVYLAIALEQCKQINNDVLLNFETKEVKEMAVKNKPKQKQKMGVKSPVKDRRKKAK